MESNVLKLTGIIDRLAPNRYMGRIKEISGIISSGETEEEAYQNLHAATRDILEYKREEALRLLAKQLSKPKVETNAYLEFSVTKSHHQA